MGYSISTVKLKIINFRGDTWGMLVKHSPRWFKESNYGGPEGKQLGMIVDHKFYADSAGHAVCWPVVHWEGDITAHTCHPVNIIPYRKKDQNRLLWIEMEA